MLSPVLLSIATHDRREDQDTDRQKQDFRARVDVEGCSERKPLPRVAALVQAMFIILGTR